MSNAWPAGDPSNGAQSRESPRRGPVRASGLDGLAAIGCDVVHDPALKDEALAAALAETQAEVLVVRSTKVTEAMMDAGRLALIVRAGAGYNTIDVAAASVRGIYVSNCPGRNAVAVAELAFGLILALDRRIPDNVADLRAGRWNKQEYAKARGLYGTTLGLLGFGNIAQELARRAQAFGCDLVIWARRFEDDPDPDLTRFGLDHGRAGRRDRASPAEVAERADSSACTWRSIPRPGGSSTRTSSDACGRARWSSTPPGPRWSTTTRWPTRCGSGGSGSASTSTRTSRPPGPPRSTTRSSPCPGSTGRTTSARRRTRRRRRSPPRWCASSPRSVDTGRVPNVVNLARRTPASHVLVIRHRDRPGVLAHVFEHLRQADINVQETENIVFEGAEAAIARINVDRPPVAAELDAIAPGNEDILSVQLVAL